MIYCPKCGTANRRGSRFCNECGEPLPLRTALRCPMCGTMNPVVNVYCDQCHARLIPMATPGPEEAEREEAPIREPAAPTMPPEEERKERPPEEIAEEAEPEEHEAEDWLARLRALAAEEVEEPEPAEEPIEPVEIPDWLQEMAPAEAAEPEAAPPTTEAVPEETAPSPPPTLAETPDWLQEMAPAETAEPEAVPPAAEAAPEEAAPPTPLPVPAEIPDWLQEMAPPEAAEPEAAPPAAEAAPEEAAPPTPPPVPAEIPDWLRGIAPAETAEPEAAPPAAEIAARAEAPPEAPPEVVPAVQPPIELPTRPPEPEVEAGAAEGLAPAEIPDWLEALRPRPEAAEREPIETEGPLEGLRGVLTPTSAIKAPALRETVPVSEVSEVSLSRAELLQGLLTRPAEAPQPKAREGKRGIRGSERVQRWLVTAVLLIAIGSMLVAPVIIPSESIPTLAGPAGSPAADRRMGFQRLTKLHDVIQGIRPEDTVLIACEYGPPEADELNLVAEPVMRHVLDQGAHISIVSTRPEGQAIATALLRSIAVPEEQYTLLHYRPGNAAGVSQLLADAETRPALILVLTAQPGPLRWWVEQTRALHGSAVPVVAGVSAALEPAASPYLDVSAGQVTGAIVGLSGAAAYEMLRGSAGQAVQRLNALAVGHVAIVGLMIVGAVIYALGDLRRRGE